MIRINTAWLIETFAKIEAINVHYQPLAFTYEVARESLDSIISNSILTASLKASINPSYELLSLIENAVNNAETNSDKSNVFGPIIQEADANVTKAKWLSVKSILTAEIGVLPIYIVSPKGAYDTETLINNGQNLFPRSLNTIIPSTKDDAVMVGKALIYEMPTACAFHNFRILEAVSRKYIRKFVTDKDLKNIRTLGQIARELVDKEYGEKTIACALRDIVSLHRNPIIHPDDVITLEQAVSLVGMSHAVISPMLEAIES